MGLLAKHASQPAMIPSRREMRSRSPYRFDAATNAPRRSGVHSMPCGPEQAIRCLGACSDHAPTGIFQLFRWRSSKTLDVAHGCKPLRLDALWSSLPLCSAGDDSGRRYRSPSVCHGRWSTSRAATQETGGDNGAGRGSGSSGDSVWLSGLFVRRSTPGADPGKGVSHNGAPHGQSRHSCAV